MADIETHFNTAPADFMPVGYIAFDRHGTVLDINRAATVYWKKNPEELIHRAIQELIAAEYVFPISAFLEALFRTGLKQTCEVQLMTTADNPVRFVQIVGIVSDPDENGNRKCIAALIDITERRKTEDTFELTRFSINHAVDPVFWVESSGVLSYVNDATCRVLGIYREELLKMRFPEIEHETKQDGWTERWQRIKKVGSLITRSRFKMKSGLVLPVELTINFISFSGKEYLVVHARDMSEQRHVEEALRNSEARYRRLFESISDYVYTVRVEDGRPVSTTHGSGCIHVTGYTPQEYDADPNLWYRMIFEEDRAKVLEHSTSALSGLPTDPIEHRIVHKNGSIRWIRNTPVVRKESQGRVLMHEGIINDITERKKAEFELKQANSHLEELQKQRDEFLVMISHDLRTPLVTGLGYIDMLVNGKFGEIPQEALNGMSVAIKNLRRLQKLIDDVLNYQSLTLQQREDRIVLSPFMIGELLRECASELVVRTARAESAVIVDEEASLPPVSGNIDMIRRVISNLLNNSHKHSGDNTTITLSAKRNGPDKVRIAIKDNGKGISEDIKSHIFSSFVKSASSHEGTGLGLAIVKTIIEAHGFYPELNSSVSNGTEIAFNLKVSKELPKVKHSSSGRNDKIVNSHPGAKILVVDDDPDTLDLLTIMLTKLGYKIITALSGENGLIELSKTNVDMALLDMTLTGMDGIELCRRIKAMPEKGKMPVYMFTARADEEAKVKSIQSGCDGYITKPVAMNDIFAIIEKALNSL
jgi:PAS domain S-box-containing protein